MFALILFVSSLLASTTTARAEPPMLNPDVARFKGDVDGILALRVRTLNFYYHVKGLVEAAQKQPIPEKDLQTLSKLHTEHTNYAMELTYFVIAAKGAKASELKISDLPTATALTLELAAELTFIDSIDQVIGVFDDLPSVRTILNRADPTTGRPKNALYETMKKYYSVKFYNRREDLIQAFDKVKNSAEFKASVDLNFLKLYIEQSEAYKRFESQSYWERAKTKTRMYEAQAQLKLTKSDDQLDNFFSHKIVGGASKVFGNGVGSIQFRDGKLKNNAALARKMRAILQPGDLLLESTPFRATSKFIPGHYGHVAMWVGTEAQLMTDNFKGVYDEMWKNAERSINEENRKHPGRFPLDTIAKAKAGMKVGASILEALRPYVVMNTPEHFLDIDDLLILRPSQDPLLKNPITLEDIRKALPLGMQHLGQAYDFNFDAYTNDQIVCSELAFKAYPMVPFKLDRTAGRWTINPDAVAREGVIGSFVPVMMVRDGIEITKNLKNELANALGMNQSGLAAVSSGVHAVGTTLRSGGW